MLGLPDDYGNIGKVIVKIIFVTQSLLRRRQRKQPTRLAVMPVYARRRANKPLPLDDDDDGRLGEELCQNKSFRLGRNAGSCGGLPS